MVDSVFFEEIRHVAAQIFARLGIAQVKERLACSGHGQEVLRHVFVKVRSVEDPLRLKPYHEFRSGFVNDVGHTFQPVWKA